MQALSIVKGSMMAASITMLLLAAKMANAENLMQVEEMENAIPVLKQSIDRGDVVTHNMLEMKEYRGQTVPRFIIQNPGNVIGKESLRNVRAGMPLYTVQVREVPAVRKGTMAPVIFKKGRVQLSTDGLIMADAEVGDFVKVLNQDSKQMLQGVVQKNGAVLVN